MFFSIRILNGFLEGNVNGVIGFLNVAQHISRGLHGQNFDSLLNYCCPARAIAGLPQLTSENDVRYGALIGQPCVACLKTTIATA